jgi:hypothetical protein
LTGFTIALSAAKRATCLSLTPVDTEIHGVVILFDDDPRLIAGAAAAVACYANAAESAEPALPDLRRAVHQACAEVSGMQQAASARIILRLKKYVDRIEMEIRRAEPAGSGKSSSSPLGAAAHPTSAAVFSGVDRVQRESQDGIPVTRLTKFLSRPAHKA